MMYILNPLSIGYENYNNTVETTKTHHWVMGSKAHAKTATKLWVNDGEIAETFKSTVIVPKATIFESAILENTWFERTNALSDSVYVK